MGAGRLVYTDQCKPGTAIHYSGAIRICRSATERLKQANIASSVGNTGDFYDNAMAETINGLYKAEVTQLDLTQQVSEKMN